MKIVIKRKVAFVEIGSSEEYMKVVFAHISHMGHIQEVRSTNSNTTEQTIEISMLPQCDTNPVDLASQVREAISMRGDLSLVSIEGVRNHVKVPGLIYIGRTDEGGAIYKVDREYPLFLVRDLVRAAQCTKPDIYAVHFMYEELSGGILRYTGVSSISVQKSRTPGLINAYNLFAQDIMRSEGLRNKIINDEVSEMSFIINMNSSSTIRYKEREPDVELKSGMLLA